MIKHDTAIIILKQGIKDLDRYRNFGCTDFSYGHLSGTAHSFYLCDVITGEEYEYWNDAIDKVYMEANYNE